MSGEDEEFGSITEEAADTFYEFGRGVGSLVTGDLDGAVDNFLDASSSAMDTITDGVFSHVIDRFEGDTGFDTREMLQDGLETVGEAVGDFAWEATEAVGDAADYVVDTVTETATEVYDTVSDAADYAYDTVSETASDAYDTVSDAASDVWDWVTE